MTQTGITFELDFARLLKLRLVVARHGEMDLARWWNSQGMLGRQGAVVLRRGFPTTHYFAQARVVFEVARSRCCELFNPPGCVTLWNLPAEIEDAFDEHWQLWLDEGDQWAPLFERLAKIRRADLIEALTAFELLTPQQCEVVGEFRRSAEGRAVRLHDLRIADDELMTLLAAGFARGEPGKLAIPYARLED